MVRSRHSRRTQPDPASDEDTQDIDVTQDAGYNDAGYDDEAYGNGERSHPANELRDQLARKLVRYALSCEYARKPIRRVDVVAKILGTHSREFKAVFAEAQLMLEGTFGMKMEELPKPEKVTVAQKRAAASQSAASASSNSWILVSTLEEKYRIPSISVPTMAPTREAESEYTGLYSTIVSIIYLSGGSITADRLDVHLRKLNADINTPSGKTELTIQRMINHGYLQKVKDSSTGDEIVSYHVGPRGKVEIGTEGVAKLVRTVYGEDGPEDLEKRLEASLGMVQDHRPATSTATQSRRGRRRTEPRDEDEDDEDDDDDDE